MDSEFDVDVDIEFGGDEHHYSEEKHDHHEVLKTRVDETEDLSVGHDSDSESFGYSGQPIYFIDNDTAVYVCGNSIRFFSPDNGVKQHIWGAGSGIGAIAVHRNTDRIAYAERGMNPRIFIINYSRYLKLKVFNGGTHLEYADLAFSRDGKFLVSLGCLPDFNLVVWDANAQQPLVQATAPACRYASFNPRNNFEICTSGGSEGNLVFWKLEKNYKQYSLSMIKVTPPKLNNDGRLKSSESKSILTQDEQGVFAEFGPHCWNIKGEVYCGLNTGHLHLYNTSKAEPVYNVKISDSPINHLLLSHNFVIVATKAGNIYWISSNDHTITSTLNLQNYDIRTLSPPPDYSRFLVGSANGTLHMIPYMEPSNGKAQAKVKKIADFHNGAVTGLATLAHSHQMITIGADGSMRLWNYLEKPLHGLVSKISHGSALTSISAAKTNVVAVGSEHGFLRVFEIGLAYDDRRPPALIYRARIHKSTIHKVVYHPSGALIATAGKDDASICMIDSSTTAFATLGYVSIIGRVLDMVWYSADGVNHLFVSTDGGYLYRLTPPARSPTMEYDNKDVQKSILKLGSPARAITVDQRTSGAKKQNLYCVTQDKKLKRFTMPERTGDPDLIDSLDVTPPKEEFKAHEKPAEVLAVSPNEMWLASGGGDGIVAVRSLDLLRKVVEMKGHDAFRGGIDSFCFSYDSQYMISGSSGDQIVFCRSTKGVDDLPVIRSSAQSRPLFPPGETQPINIKDDTDNPAELTVLEAFAFEAKKASEKQFLELRDINLGKFEHIKSTYENILASNSLAPEMEKLSEEDLVIDIMERDRLVAEGESRVHQLREQIRYENVARDMLTHRLTTEFYDSMEEHSVILKPFKAKFQVTNFPIPKRTAEELSKLEQIRMLRRVELREFRIRKMEAEAIQKKLLEETASPTQSRPTSARPPSSTSTTRPNSTPAPPTPTPTPTPTPAPTNPKETKKEPVDGSYLPKFGQLTTKDSMREVDAMLTPPPPQAPAEPQKPGKKGLTSSSRQSSARKLNVLVQQQATNLQLIDLLDDEEFDPDDIPDDWPSLLYHAFDVYTPYRKVTQIHVLRHLIYLTKQKFNSDVKAFLESKKVEIGKIEERNDRILEISKELGEPIDIFKPTLDPSELPESVFHVNDSQITAARFVEQSSGSGLAGDASNGLDVYERALRVMMGGRLDAKAQQPLEEELVRPAWMDKPEAEMTEEEIKELRAFEKKVEAIKEEKEKTRKALETELKKLQQQISDICTAFDDRLQKFFAQKQATDQHIFEAELQQAILAQALLNFEDQEKKEAVLAAELETLKQQKNKSTLVLTDLKADIDRQREEYDALVAHDKALEKAFRRDFYEKEIEEFYDFLFKYFKRRPKAGVASPTATFRNTAGDPFDIDTLTRAPSWVDETVDKPEGLDELTWSRVLEARSIKIASEQDLKKKNAALSELVKYCEEMQARDDELRNRLDGILKQLHDFAQYRLLDAYDLELLLKLKQGQVEVEQAPFVTDYSECVFINKQVIEDYNTNIKTQAKDKVALLKEMKNTKKLIRKKKWENQGMDMQAEDLMEKTKQFQLLRVTKQLQTFIKGGGEDQHALENATLEKRAEHGQRSHEQKLQELKKQLAKVTKLAMEKELENERLDGELAELESATHERQKIFGVQVSRRLGPTEETDSRLSRLLRGRKLADKVHTQEEQIHMLNSALDTLRKRTFPTFDQMQASV